MKFSSKRKKILAILITPMLAIGAIGIVLLGHNFLTKPSKAISGWDAGNIISDHVFTNKNSMNAGDIQAFLNSKVSHCDTWGEQTSEFGGGTRRQWAEARGFSPPYTCLKDYSQDGKSAAQIIYETSHEFAINPQVLIVLLQKEQSLVTDTWPLSIQYRSATGYGCPDTAPCDAEYYGFTNQVRWAARMFRAIMNNSPTWYTPYVLGNNFIRYSPDASCGGSNVNIQNRATQALYNYTPYQPNQAALDAGWGTVHCGAYGNRNFYLYFLSWFGSTREAPYVSLSNPRWMKTAAAVHKKNPWTKESVGSAIASNTQLRFVDKIQVDGIWYLRTEHDRHHNLHYGIPQSDVAEIEFEPLDVPRYMELSSNAHKTNPRNMVSSLNHVFSAGTTMKFTSKIFVNGHWFFRTEQDEQQGGVSGFYAVRVRELTYKTFETPRYLKIKNNTNRVDPALGTTDSTTFTAGSEIKFASKAFVGGEWYYRTEQDTNANTKLAIPSSDIEEVAYTPFGAAPKWFQLKADAKKIHPASGTVTHTNFIAGTPVRITERIVVNGQLYYRTEFDSTGAYNRAFPASDIEEIPYVPLEEPRQMQLIQAGRKLNPKTGEAVDSTIPQGTSIMFTTKILINGTWYLRTQSDSTSGLDKAIPLTNLTEAS